MNRYYKMNETLDKHLQDKKPEMKPPTRKQYVSALIGLYRYANPDKELVMSWFDKRDEVDKAIDEKTKSHHSKRNYYSALVCLTDDSHYKDKMNEGNRLISSISAKNQRSETQEENWKSYEDVKALVEKYKKQTKALLSPTSGQLTDKQLVELSDFILLALSSGYYIPPRRSADWVNFRIHNVNKSEHNYLQGSKLVFNKYKTAKTYGKQEVEIPRELLTILKNYIKKNPHDYLLVNNKGEPLSQVVITQRLNKIFGSKISTSMLRHIYITHNYEGVDVAKLKRIADEMGHDIETAMDYVVR